MAGSICQVPPFSTEEVAGNICRPYQGVQWPSGVTCTLARAAAAASAPAWAAARSALRRSCRAGSILSKRVSDQKSRREGDRGSNKNIFRCSSTLGMIPLPIAVPEQTLFVKTDVDPFRDRLPKPTAVDQTVVFWSFLTYSPTQSSFETSPQLANRFLAKTDG